MPPRNATYYRGDLRRDLLDAALAVVAADGPAAISLRALARTLGVSHAAPANHFADKTALFTALAAEGFEQLSAEFAAAVSALPDGTPGRERLRAGGEAYLRFALRHPAHFAVMWRTDLRDETDPVLDAASAAPLAFLHDGVAMAQSQGWAPGQDTATIAWLLWCSVHGLAVLWSGGTIGSVSGAADAAELGAAMNTLLLSALSGGR